MSISPQPSPPPSPKNITTIQNNNVNYQNIISGDKESSNTDQHHPHSPSKPQPSPEEVAKKEEIGKYLYERFFSSVREMGSPSWKDNPLTPDRSPKRNDSNMNFDTKTNTNGSPQAYSGARKLGKPHKSNAHMSRSARFANGGK
jgi:hypothetical protein